MASVEVILLQRVEKLGQMGEVVKVKPGFARNFLLPQKKAIRASKDNMARFEQQRSQLEAQNLKRREEAERVAERVGGLSVIIIRQAGESGSLYGSVSSRDIAEACTAGGLTITRPQVVLGQPDQDARADRTCAWCCTRRCRSPSPSTWRAAPRKPPGRRAASASLGEPPRTRGRRRHPPPRSCWNSRPSRPA